ncbi:acetyl-CoA carboxylase biotin carboxylase subunit [Cognatishimia activa]|uniref:Acetyl/propionyl/methylcrotonyl-CoA carboxylase subunit alpha n=1 Tax=Cognatishimia activa TaxID=1715691 RepID=A0A975EPL1_9RHOB|nr:acetyl/propionyl/methylcrotonyl-CoA carboxylase subunit alpha [Cognatishimia activa]QTN35870.1 acetyl/propionyl/methylcrotonyl-CoA carboxylase subunit alpha [Cognatishimia activa]
MFQKILIANRGEIACRVIETAQSKGVACVAVHSDVDARAKHVAMADEAVSLGGAAPAESYLRGDAIIEAALATGAEAIHPGYGFLSENPEFVDAVEAAGLVFIGPSSTAIRAMGLKDAAKALMVEAGVPVVPGYHGDNQDAAFLAEEAARIGYPVMIKAVAGGGGKGMRIVETASDFAEALASAQGEAMTGFGNADVLIEKFIQNPRHIEIQVFGDGTRAVHLFERDCSLQRRHQKVLEEAPAPGMTEEVREAMGQAAVRAAEAIGYKGAGTVEFIVDGSDGLRADRFWFMEMNTRLQVEHPVTEAITGVDLVEWQLRVASGEPIPMAQEDLTITGHSFEARLYAEDANNNFLPAIGRISHLKFSDGCRADSGVRAGDEISPFYDPMVAKLITHGATREIALAKMRRALGETELAGTVTNLGFLAKLAAHEGFSKGEVDTGLIARDYDQLIAAQGVTSLIVAQAGLFAVLPSLTPESGFSLWGALRQSFDLSLEEEVYPVAVEVHSPSHIAVQALGDTFEFGCAAGVWTCDGQPVHAHAAERRVITVFAGQSVAFQVVDPLDCQTDADAAGNSVAAPMPGVVKALFVKPGDVVKKGDRLAVLEAMKMEHALLAGMDSVVSEVPCSEGAQVNAGDVLILMEEGAE